MPLTLMEWILNHYSKSKGTYSAEEEDIDEGGTVTSEVLPQELGPCKLLRESEILWSKLASNILSALFGSPFHLKYVHHLFISCKNNGAWIWDFGNT